MQFSEHFTEFKQAMLETDHRRRTIHGYIRDLHIFEKWFIEARGAPPVLEKITPLDVRAFREYMLHTRKLKPSTINRRLAGLRVYLEYAVGRKLLPQNPAAKIRGVKQPPHAPRWLTPAEQRQLRRALDREVQISLADSGGEMSFRVRQAIRDRAMFLLLLNTGLRSSELMQLTLDDVDLSERRGAVFVRDGKGGKARTIPLNREARRTLREYLEVRFKVDSDNFFVGQRGRIGSRQLLRLLKKYCWLAKLEPNMLTIHVLRHTFGKNLVDSGVSLDRVATLLGHVSLNTTRIYTTPDENDLQQAVERLANV